MVFKGVKESKNIGYKNALQPLEICTSRCVYLLLPTSIMRTQTASRKKPDQSLGMITLEGDKVIWHNDDLVFGTFSLADIAVIGERTNSNGPWFDDWFIDLSHKTATGSVFLGMQTTLTSGQKFYVADFNPT